MALGFRRDGDGANNVTAVVSRPLLFKKRPTRRGEMLGTMPRPLPSSANARGVQCVTGRPESAGASHATATMGPAARA